MLETKKVANELGVNPKTVWLWIKQGRIKAIRLGKNFKVSEEELDYIKKNGLREKSK